MPRGPHGEKRPGDTVGAAIMVAKIATGEIDEQLPEQTKRSAGLVGGKNRAKALSPERRTAIAQKAARARGGNA